MLQICNIAVGALACQAHLATLSFILFTVMKGPTGEVLQSVHQLFMLPLFPEDE